MVNRRTEHENDGGEEQNLYDEKPDVVEQLKRELINIRESKITR